MISTRELIDRAESRWQAVTADRPDLRAAVDLQRLLVGRAAAALDTLASSAALAVPDRLALRAPTKLAQGVPVLRGELLTLPVETLEPLLRDVCAALARGEARVPAEHISATLDAHRLDVATLLGASVARDKSAIRTGADHLGLSADLLWLVAELAVAPFVHLLQAALRRDTRARLEPAIAMWSRGYCWACGSWPALAEWSHSGRTLRCSFCGANWMTALDRCIYCGEIGDRFSELVLSEDRPERRIELCGSCHRYLKAVEVSAPIPFVLLPVEDLATADLDLAAMHRGYERPALPDIGLAAT